MVDGIDPVTVLKDKSRASNMLGSPMLDGIDPTRLLAVNCSAAT
jgi:hypothetical protein